MLFKYVKAAISVTISTFTFAGILFYLKHIGKKRRKNQTVYLMSIMQYAIFGIVDHQIKTCWKNILTIRNEMHH